jgi:hypothetical protein
MATDWVRGFRKAQYIVVIRIENWVHTQTLQPPQKANRISVGFSPGGMLFANFSRIREFFRSPFSRAERSPGRQGDLQAGEKLNFTKK